VQQFKNLNLLMKYFSVDDINSSQSHSNSKQFFTNTSLQNKRGYLIFKRIIDVVFSSIIVLLIFPWLLPMLAIAIKLNSKGPVFFKQKRVGFNGKIFECLKLRTMYVNNFADTKQAAKNDPRITGFGKFIRNTGLDELPQFINIFKGEMTIVGPRPHMVTEHNQFSVIIPGYASRNLVKPGITGLSQVKGYRGIASNFSSITKRFQLDNYYVHHVGFVLDIKIMFETFLLIIKAIVNKNKMVSADQSSLQNNLINNNNEEEKPADYPAHPSLSKLRY
jgi:putative colanic acid biosynthesis UDP-glucose lipid carrier transferase